MGTEIERKFLLKGDSWRSLVKGTKYRQGYLSSTKERIVRVRTIDDKGYLTIKGITTGATRVEYEYDIPENASPNNIVAEVELESEDQRFEKPEWIGDEVTGDPKYFNSNLVINPYIKW